MFRVARALCGCVHRGWAQKKPSAERRQRLHSAPDPGHCCCGFVVLSRHGPLRGSLRTRQDFRLSLSSVLPPPPTPAHSLSNWPETKALASCFARLDASSGAARGPDLLLDTVARQTDFDVTIGQCVVSDRNVACMRHFPQTQDTVRRR